MNILLIYSIIILLCIIIISFKKETFIINNIVNKKIAIIIHVGNINVLNKIINDYPNFFNNNFDFFITCNSESVKSQIKIENSKIFIVENRGMDIGPFLFIIEYLKDKNNYDYYIKLHTKTDDNWRNNLITSIYNNLNEIVKDHNDGIKMYGSSKYILDINFSYNYNYVLDILYRNYPEYVNNFLKYCKSKNIEKCDSPPLFVAGTIFLFNNKYFDLLSKIKDINYEISILETGYSLNDKNNPRKTHSWEYLFGYLNYLNKTHIISLDKKYISNNMKVGLYVRCKDEKNLEEFMKYYYSLGFDYIIIFDDFSSPSVKKIVNNFNFDKSKYDIVSNIKVSNIDNSQVLFKKIIYPKLKKHTDYVLYVDLDEYLYMGDFKNIKELIKTYAPFDQLKINWVLFGNNNKMFNNPSNILDNFTKSSQKFNKHVKCLVKTDSILLNDNPHFFYLKENSLIKNTLNKETDIGPFEENLENYTFDKSNVYIAHYIIQDTNTYLNRRVFRNGTNTLNFKKNGFPTFVNDNRQLILEILHYNKDYNGEQNELVNELKNYFNEHNCNNKDNYDLIY